MEEKQDSLRHKLSRVNDHESQLMEDITAYVSKQGDLARIVNHLTEQIERLGSCQSLNQAADERPNTHFKSPMKREETPVRGDTTSTTANFQIKANLDLGKFSGSDPTPAEELMFEQWYTNVRAYQNDYPLVYLLPAVCKSIIGKAKSVVGSLGS